MAVERWETPAAIATVLSTELNSLANNTRCAPSSAYDNLTNLYTQLVAELVCDYGTNPTVNTTLDLYFMPSLDDTDYADGDASTVPAASCFCCSFQVQATTNAQRIVSNPFTIPPLLGKFLLYNNATGQTLAASGNTVKVRPLNREVA